MVQVFEMDAEVEEMTRDRRNNILVHGLPVQVGAETENVSLIIFLSLTSFAT